MCGVAAVQNTNLKISTIKGSLIFNDLPAIFNQEL